MRTAVEITVLGCRGGVPTPDSPCSGYLLRYGDVSVLLDCGPGIAGRFSATDGRIDLDAILVSHMHMDHCYDLPPLGYARWGYERVQERRGIHVHPLPLHLPVGGKAVLERINAQFPLPTVPGLDNMFEDVFAAREYAFDEEITVGDVRVRTVEMHHALPCAGFRVHAGNVVVAYSGDTGPGEAVHTLAKDADLFLCEASFLDPDHLDHGHLSAREAGEAAAAAGVRHLVLTHFMGPPLSAPEDRDRLREDAEAAFGRPVTLASANQVITVPA